MQKLLLIDSDGLVYHSLREDLGECVQILNEKIQNMFEKTEATHYVMFISQGKYFRHNLYPEYKQSREKYRNNPSSKWVKVLKQYLIAEWNAQWMDNAEADDLVAYWYNPTNILYDKTTVEKEGLIEILNKAVIFDEKIICSPDKDLLQSIPGKHFNYSYKLEDKNDLNSVIKGWWVETNEEDSNYFRLKQLISGDNADDIKTPFPENAGEWFVQNKMNFNDVVSAYILGFNYETPKGMKKYVKGLGTSKGLFELSRNYRLLHMLDCDEDFMREVDKLPQFPEIQSINKQSVEQQIIPEF